MAKDLQERVEQRATSSEVERRKPTMAQQISQMQDQFALAMPRGMEAVQLVRDAQTALRKTPKLAECTPASVLGGLMNIAQLGLRVGVLGHAWLIPMRGEAQLIIGYQGMIELAHRTGKIKSLIARPVYSNEKFEVSYGLDEKLVHEPKVTGDKGEPIAYYAVARYIDGGYSFLVMSHEDMIAHKERYAMARENGRKNGPVIGPWRDDFEGMALKTVVRQLAKWMPKSVEFASAIAADETIRVDSSIDPDAMLHGREVDVSSLPEAPEGDEPEPEEPEGEPAP